MPWCTLYSTMVFKFTNEGGFQGGVHSTASATSKGESSDKKKFKTNYRHAKGIQCTSISKGPTLSILQPTPKLHLQFSEQQCYVGCILIPCIDKVGPFEMDVHRLTSLRCNVPKLSLIIYSEKRKM